MRCAWPILAGFLSMAATALSSDGPAPAASRSRFRTATGVLAAYDPVSRVLTLRGVAGSSAFHVAPDARAWLGKANLSLAELAKHVGAQLTVAWSDSENGPVTHTVRLDDRAAKAPSPPAGPIADRKEVLRIRGQDQTLHLYGSRGAPPVIVTSGDGGYVHLGPEVAERLAALGYFVVGFDAKAYLSSFTSHAGALSVADVPRDYAALVNFASGGGASPTLLVGVSVGAGLSLLAATAPELQPRLQGVVALGLPDQNELAWRFRDSIIYLTKGAPDEPSFSALEWADRVAPVPLAEIHSTHDEFAPLADTRAILARAREPKRQFLVEARDHRFSGGTADFERSLDQALAWVAAERGQGQ